MNTTTQAGSCKVIHQQSADETSAMVTEPINGLPDDEALLRMTFVRQKDIVSRDIAGEAVLVPIRGCLADLQRIFSLNPIGEEIWQRIDGVSNVMALREAIVASYEVDDPQALADLRAFLGSLLAAGLIAQAY